MDPQIMEFAAVSVTVVCYKLCGFHDFRSGYTAVHSPRLVEPNTAEFIAISVTVDCHKLHGFHDI